MSDYDLLPGELVSIPVLPTGVIIGVREHVTIEQAEAMESRLERTFPGVRFAIISGCTAVASFTYDEPEPTAAVTFDDALHTTLADHDETLRRLGDS